MPSPLNYYTLNGMIADVGTANTYVFVVPRDGYLKEFNSVLQAAISGADDVITVSVDGSALSPTITVANSGSAAGDYDFQGFDAPVKKGSRVTVANSGASTGTAPIAYTLVFSG